MGDLSCRGQNGRWLRYGHRRQVMLADAEKVQPDLVGKFDRLDEVALSGAARTVAARLRVLLEGAEADNTDFHEISDVLGRQRRHGCQKVAQLLGGMYAIEDGSVRLQGAAGRETAGIDWVIPEPVEHRAG